MEEPLLRIGELAAFFNVSPKAIRIYEKKGILIPDKVDPDTGYRYYRADQVQVLDALLELKALGFSLGEIKGILRGEMTSEQLADALLKKKGAWQDMISDAENKIDALEQITKRMASSREIKALPELTEDERAWLLVKMVCVEDIHGQSALSEAIWL